MAAPVLQQIVALDRTLRMDYDQPLDADPLNAPEISDITVTSSVTGTLSTNSVIVFGQSVYVGVDELMQGTITVDSISDDIKNLSGQAAAHLAGAPVTNNTGVADVTVPYVIGGTVENTTVLLYFSEILSLSQVPVAGAFTLTVNGEAAVLTVPSTYGTTLVMAVTPAIPAGANATFTYTPPVLNPLQDYAGLMVSPIVVPIVMTNLLTISGTVPIIDLIASDITSRLSNITIANGFLFDLTVVDDLKTAPALAEGKAWVSYEDPVTEDEAPLGHEQFTATFHIEIATSMSTALDTPLSSKEFQIEAEVMKYLQVDYHRNNLAVDTVPLGPTRIVFGDGGWGGISVNLLVRFRTLYGDRFSQ